MKSVLIFVFILVFLGCRQDEYLLYRDDSRLQFGPIPEKIYVEAAEWEDTLKMYSFLSRPIEKLLDTVYFDLYNIGPLIGEDRPYKLRQTLLDSVNNALPGIHYKAFDDPDVVPLYIIPANSSHVKVPIILMRDTSLESKVYTLKFEIEENEYFKLGDWRKTWRKLVLSEILQRPTLWLDAVFGSYSKVKHRFMIEQTGLKWDDDYLSIVKSDVTMSYYWQRKFQELLYEYNNNSENENVPLYDEYGREVKFGI